VSVCQPIAFGRFAQYAVSKQAEIIGEKLNLVMIKEAQHQVVAGMNYKLSLVVMRNGKEEYAVAVVWAKLDGTHELTEWAWQ
jgi:hypothetical protein